MLGLRLGRRGARGDAALDRLHAGRDVFCRSRDVAHDARAGERRTGILRRVGDLKKPGARADRIARHFQLTYRELNAERPNVKRRYGVCTADGSIAVRLRQP